MWSRLLALACALLLLPAQALAGVKEKVAALAPSGLVLVMDEKGNELIARNADQPFVPASSKHGRVRFVISLTSNDGAMRFRLLRAIESGL
jgi:hypothetical protein